MSAHPRDRPGPEATLERMRRARAVAVVRADDVREAVAVAAALAHGGLTAIELTFTTPGAGEAIAQARADLGADVLVGAGTVTTARQAETAIAAGAEFLVTPHLDEALLPEMLRSGALVLPGVLTPSEVARALALGAPAVKLFPASSVGVAHLRSLHGPFPGLRAIPTGGVTIDDAGSWLAAGAVAVGLGGELAPAALRARAAWDEISRGAERLVERLAA